jgi:hypothetical protein
LPRTGRLRVLFPEKSNLGIGTYSIAVIGWPAETVHGIDKAAAAATIMTVWIGLPSRMISEVNIVSIVQERIK